MVGHMAGYPTADAAVGRAGVKAAMSSPGDARAQPDDHSRPDRRTLFGSPTTAWSSVSARRAVGGRANSGQSPDRW